jgi:hypothetical protein
LTAIYTENKLRVYGVESSLCVHTTTTEAVESGLDYLVGHFEGFEEGRVFPRTISTKATKGAQVSI